MPNTSKPFAVVTPIIGAAAFPTQTVFKAADLPTGVGGIVIPPFRPGTVVHLEGGGQAVFAKASATIAAATGVCNLTAYGTALPDATPTFTADSSVVSVASTAHGLTTGAEVIIINQTAGNNVLLNGIWNVVVTSANAFTITLDTKAPSSGAGAAITAASGNAKPIAYTMAASGGAYISPDVALASGDFAWFYKNVA